MHIGHRQEETKISYDKIGEKANAAVEEVIYRNNAVGAIVGYYDEPLTILSVSDYLLNELGYTPETFTQITEGYYANFFRRTIHRFWKPTGSQRSREKARARFIRQVAHWSRYICLKTMLLMQTV